MKSKEFEILLNEVIENRVLIESLYKSLGASEEQIKEHIKKIKPIVDKIANEMLNNK